ncbi:MAG: HIRAN domain-containing protein [Syntrophobacteria bacterium]
MNRLQAGERLALTPEPDNPYDRFAVEIHWRSVKMGYVPRSDNRHISRLLRQGADLVCRTILK